MIRFTILLIAASCAYSLPKGLKGQEGRISQGYLAEPGQIPYQAIVMRNGAFQCSGAILRQNWILTAQHCVNSSTAADYTIKVGTTTLDHGGDVYSVKRILKHPGYDITNHLNDLALVETKTNITFNDNVQPIALNSWIIDPNSDVVASGWGLRDNEPGETTPNDLYFTLLVTMSMTKCAEKVTWMKVDLDRHLCTLSGLGEGTCAGDDGGPIVYDGELRALIIDSTCGRHIPEVHLDVTAYADWIIGTMNFE